MRRRTGTKPWAAVAGLLALGIGVRADDAAPVPPAPVAQPGVMEFSGRLMARPWTIAELRARGLNEAQSASQDARARQRLTMLGARRIEATDEYLVTVPADRGDAAMTIELSATGDYAYVHPDWWCFPSGSGSDPEIVSQYFHQRLQTGLAWGVAPASSSVIVAVCDSGVDLAHPEFAGRLVSGYNSADGVAQAQGGSVQDINGHGTLVAGCAAAARGNALGGAGVGAGLSIMPVRVTNLPSGGALLSQITAGARWAVDHGARVVNVSFSGVTNPAVQTTGAYVRASGGVLVWAAGNFGTTLSPAADWPDVVIVGSVGPEDVIAGTSNVGVPIDCVAPGVDVYGPALGGGFWSNSGTSFAAPIAAGTLGLIFSARPDFTSTQAEEALLAGCEDLGATGEDGVYGAGRINAYRSVWAAANGFDKPIAGPDEATTTDAQALRIDVLGNDADVMGRPLEIAVFDAVTSLGATVERSVGTGPGDRDELRYVPWPGATGADSFEYVVSNGVEMTVVEVRVTVLASGSLRDPDVTPGVVPGLSVRYFDLEVFAPLRLPRFDLLEATATDTWPLVDFAPTEVEFAGALFQDDVGAVAEGLLTAPSDGHYRLSLESDDGSRLVIGDEVVVSHDGLHGAAEASGLIGLRAGRHRMRIEFFDRRGSASLVARIEGPGLPRQVIPAGLLSRPLGIVLDINEDGVVDPDDLGDFINLYFSGDLRADADGNGQINPDDLGDFINAYFGR